MYGAAAPEGSLAVVETISADIFAFMRPRVVLLIGFLLLAHSGHSQSLGGSGGLRMSRLETQRGGLRAGALHIHSAQAGKLPLTLPDVRPTQRPAQEYQATMYKKAMYQEALRKRYWVYRSRVAG
jgi:hypothetical protein